jgi:hypothetical protein
MSEDQGNQGTQDLSEKAPTPQDRPKEEATLGNVVSGASTKTDAADASALESDATGKERGESADSSQPEAAGDEVDGPSEETIELANIITDVAKAPEVNPDLSALAGAMQAAANAITPPDTGAAALAAASAAGAAASQTQPLVTPPLPVATIVRGSLVSGSVTPSAAVKSEPVRLPATPAPIAPAAPAFIATGVTDVDQVVEGLMKNASVEAKIVINTIKEYILAMKPGRPIAQKDGVRSQVAFYNALLAAINNLEGDFRPTLQSILALLHAHKDGAFKETHVFRFVEHVPLSVEHRRGFQKITTLLKTLANPQTRQGLLRQMNFDPLLQYGLTERGRTKLAAFFGK